MLIEARESNLSRDEKIGIIFTRGWLAVDTDNMVFLRRTAGNGKYGLPKYILVLPVPKPETFQEVIEYKYEDFFTSVIRAWSAEEAIQMANRRLPKLLTKRDAQNE